ncbi:MAG: cytochrome c3 family protein [Gammaproteobacteria bacterium]|nr:cytochrome c3 family protein [Gammaproteobacteria bacterium]MDH5592925.1 cytochrome c3 family protein [Gammaproteobacteria bacterium]
MKQYLLRSASMFLLLVIWMTNVQAFQDDEGCLMCHKYPMMGRITGEGVFRSYYIVPGIFEKTVHRNVPCRDCHNYIKELPHKPVKQGVTCNTECHSITNPATGKPFSHKPIYDTYRKSVHGRDKLTKTSDSDKPYCITCHTNPLYNPKEDKPPSKIIDRCVVCHEKRQFAERWYNHTSRRIKEVRRSSEDIVAICSNCHGKKEFIERRKELAKKEGRELGPKFAFAIDSYKDSFHGKLTRIGFTETANCLNCHANEVNYYKSVHEIRPSRDPLSPTHDNNRVKTCQKCHTYADANYAQLDPHPTSDKEDNPFRYFAEMIYNWVGYIVIAGLVGISMFETFGRWRDGVGLFIRQGSSWWRKSKRGRKRVV